MTAAQRFAVALALLALTAARGAPIELDGVALEPGEKQYTLAADFSLSLGAQLEEALTNGVPLHFVVEFELRRPRWYWFDEKLASEKLELRLSYSPLAQQYQVSAPGAERSFATLAEALRALGRVRGWAVLERRQLRNGERYSAAVRMRLDTAQLPKPLQMAMMAGDDWSPASGWRRFDFTPLAPVREVR